MKFREVLISYIMRNHRTKIMLNFGEMFHTNLLQNGNYMSWKRFEIEMFSQNCSDFAKKRRNIRYLQKQFTFQIYVHLIRNLITTTFRSIKIILFTNVVILNFSEQFHVINNTIFHTKYTIFLLNEISFK